MALMVTSVATTKERVAPVEHARSSLRSELWDLTKQSPFVLIPLLSMSLFFYYRNLLTGVIFVLVFATATWLVRRMLNRPRGDVSGTQQDMLDLLTNKPWLILLGMGFLTMMFNGIKYSVIAYYFKYFVGDELLTGQYFIALLVVSILGALCTSYLANKLGRRNLFIAALLCSSALTSGFYWLPGENITYIFVLGCAAEFFAAMMPTLFFSMLGDAADYSEWRNGRRATGLVYSAGTFVQKTGNGFAGALVLVVLAGYGYNGMDATTIAASLPGMQQLMSFIPAAFGVAGALLMLFYPLSDKNQRQINAQLVERRNALSTHHQ